MILQLLAAVPAAPAAPSATAGLLQMTVYLCLLVAIMAGALIFVRRGGMRFLQARQKGERHLQISETRMLGNRQFLVVADYDGAKMLLGVCPGRIDYLCPLTAKQPDPEAFSKLLPNQPE